MPGDVAWFDNQWDGDYINWLYGGTGTCPRAQDGLPNTNGRFNTRQGQALYAANNRNGLTVSNKMKLNDKLQLTLSGDYQTEKLRSRNEFANFFFGYDSNNPENIQPNLFLDQIAYPRNGRRREFNLAFNFRFELRPWLTLTAGARYTRFNIWDDNVRKFIDNGGILQANRGVFGTRFHWHNAPHKTRAPAWNGFIDSAKGHFQTPDRQNALAIELDASRNADLTWAAVATIDAYLRYRISKNLTAEIVGTNLTDRYYMDSFSRSYMPALGRTFRIGITGKW